jgi:hypothetical protein
MLNDIIPVKINSHPEKVCFEDIRAGKTFNISYIKEIKPLLEEMENNFKIYPTMLKELLPDIPKYSLPLYEDIAYSMELFVNRIILVHSLYEYEYGYYIR